MMMMKFILTVSVFVGLLAIVFGCTCFHGHQQDKFCRSQFVIHAVPIVEQVPNPPDQTKDRVYKLVIIEVFKDTSGGLVPYTINQAYTAFHGAACGVYLTKYKSYVLGGRFDSNGNMRLQICQLNKLYSSFEPCELAWMRGFVTYNYQNSYLGHQKKPGYDCNCKVKICFKGQKDCYPNRNECIVDGKNNNKDNCKREYGQCRWNQCPKGKFEQLYFNSGY